MIKTGIIGYPLDWTLSPKLHNFLFNYFNLNGEYIKIVTPPSKLGETINFLKTQKFRGINITIPFKEMILEYVDKVDESAQSVGAVNTALLKEDKLYGFNTDTIGFESSLNFHGLELKDKKILLLGTGGASKACASVIKNKAPQEFFVAGRNKQKTKLFSRKFNAIPVNYENLKKIIGNMDVLINATPVDFSGLTRSMKKGSFYYDLKYMTLPANLQGVNILNGLIMLISQGLESFHIWTGKKITINKILELEVFK